MSINLLVTAEILFIRHEREMELLTLWLYFKALYISLKVIAKSSINLLVVEEILLAGYFETI